MNQKQNQPQANANQANNDRDNARFDGNKHGQNAQSGRQDETRRDGSASSRQDDNSRQSDNRRGPASR